MNRTDSRRVELPLLMGTKSLIHFVAISLPTDGVPKNSSALLSKSFVLFLLFSRLNKGLHFSLFNLSGCAAQGYIKPTKSATPEFNFLPVSFLQIFVIMGVKKLSPPKRKQPLSSSMNMTPNPNA